MKLKKILAVISALCVVCAGMPFLPECMQKTMTITASANILIEEEYTEGIYENLNYRKFADYIEIYDVIDNNVTEISIPAEIDGLPVTKIGYIGSDSLTTVYIPESVTEIVDHAFTNTPWLEEKKKENPLVIVNNILIDGTACTGDVIIPDNVTKIAPCAFEYCEDITSVVIPEGVTNIGFSAFEYCSALTSVTIPESVEHIGSHASYDTPWLEEKKKENPLVIVSDILIDGTDCTGDVVIPEGVTAISGDAFRECTEITSVAIPKSVTEIGVGAFSNCSALTEIVIPDGVTVIDGFVFQECTGLTSVTIPDSVKSINSGAFLGCSSLCSIELPDTITRIGFEAFTDSGLTSIVIPESVTCIRDVAFSNCSSLTSVTIPESVTSIEGYAFSGCSSLTSVTIPESVTSIGHHAFDDTPWLKAKQEENPLVIVNGILIDGTTCEGDVTIPESVTSIGNSAFSDCSSLASVIIPESVTSIEDCAFYYCENLTSVTIPESVTSIGDGAFYDCSSLASVTIPESVTSIGMGAFSHCSSLTSVTIENPGCEIYDSRETISNGDDENYVDYFNGTIYGYENSTAQAYTETYGYKFALIGSEPKTEELKQGDADGNGEIDILDVITINKAILGKENLSENGLKAIDFNGNGKPDSDESLTLLKYIVSIITDFNA